MELVFAEKPCRYLRRVVHAARAQEQTADVIVPDSFPDVFLFVIICSRRRAGNIEKCSDAQREG